TADILDIARDEQCDIIVICSRSHSGLDRWRLGRVAEQVARHSPVPVFVVHPGDKQASAIIANAPIRILLTLDGSELAEAATQPALDLAQALAAPEQITVHLLQVVDFFTAMMEDADSEKTGTPAEIGAEEHALDIARSYLKACTERIQQANPGVTVTATATLATDTAKMICDTAEAHPHHDFIAMATHGRGGLQRWALGSITERVLHLARLPLLIVRSPIAIEHDREVAEAAAEADLHR
ncbi:MAG TPA: universal stress protein, partial [Ktedonobacterales bacterium]|nr:universal stress protein [Ktedonobacterales bacterium]